MYRQVCGTSYRIHLPHYPPAPPSPSLSAPYLLPYLIDADGKVAKVWKRVRVDGHDQQVIDALNEL